MISHARSDAAPVWDREGLLDKVGGIEELIGELIELFLRDAPGRIVAIGEALDAGNCDLAWREAHGLKGACGSLSAEAMGAAAASVEREARGGKLELARAGFTTLKEEYDRLADTLSA